MAAYEHLPIFKQMMDVTVLMEQIVQNFSRYHKYTLGSELRSMCHDALAWIMEANSQTERHPNLFHNKDFHSARCGCEGKPRAGRRAFP